VGPGTAKEIMQKAGLLPATKPSEVSRDQAERLLKAIQETKIISPPTDCIVPIGEEDLKSGLKKEVNAEFYAAVSRPPEVYRGNPFAIEAAIAYGGDLPSEEPVRLMRYANRVPLLYQQAACATTDAVIDISTWKTYGLSQSKGALPVGSAVIVIHMVSVWVPFTSEAKEAIAHYPEIIKEIKLALQECGRKLGIYINKKRQVADQQHRVNIFENYIPEIASSLARLTGESKQQLTEALRKQLSKNKEFIAQHKSDFISTKGEEEVEESPAEEQ
ncbi:MAG TPA: DNA topoisomerase VI subunit B, partial [Candidatus Nanoarchaeia archaeon]|nr:DNA topoisomerase VI subunit B [Candidatus Nanoarchaeia archaeon]